MLELDCHLTHDGHVVVSHDENLLRQTGHDVAISSLKLQVGRQGGGFCQRDKFNPQTDLSSPNSPRNLMGAQKHDVPETKKKCHCSVFLGSLHYNFSTFTVA